MRRERGLVLLAPLWMAGCATFVARQIERPAHADSRSIPGEGHLSLPVRAAWLVSPLPTWMDAVVV